MIYSIGSSIGNWFLDMFSKLVFGLAQAFLTILYWIERIFKILAGIEPIPGSESTNTLLDAILGKDIVERLIKLFVLIGLAVFIISLCVGLIKAQFQKDSPGETKKVITSSFKAVLYFVFMPTLFIFIVLVSGQLLNIIATNVSEITTGNAGATSYSHCLSQDLFLSMFNKNDLQIIRENELDWHCSYDSFSNINGTDYSVSLRLGETSFQYVIILIVSAIMFWTLGIATIGLAERLINVVLLYLMGPIMIGSSALDGGQRLTVWKDRVLVKLFSIIGNILSMYIFIMILGIIGDIKNNSNATGDEYTLINYVYAIVAIAGAMCCCKGQTLIASLISQNAGQEEGLSTMATSQLAGKGLQIAGAGMKLAGAGAIGILAKGGKFGAGNKGITSSPGSTLGTNMQSNTGSGGIMENAGQQAAEKLSLGQRIGGGVSKMQNSGSKALRTAGAIAGLGMLAGKVGKFALKPITKTVGKIKNMMPSEKRRSAGLGDIKPSSKDKNVVNATKELNSANKGLYKAQRQNDKMNKKMNSFLNKNGNPDGSYSEKNRKKYETLQTNLENSNNSLSNRMIQKNNASNNLLASQMSEGKSKNMKGGKF